MIVNFRGPQNVSGPDAHVMWLGLLARQGLAGGAPPANGHVAIERSVGLHAARRPSPFTTMLARVRSQDDAEIIYRTGPPGDHVTVRCMRKTLHVLPRRLAGWAHAATRHFRERDAHRQAVNAGVDAVRMRFLVEAVCSEFSGREAQSHRVIEERLVSRGIERAHARAGLKLAWEAGKLVYVNASQHWNREIRRFYLTDQVFPELGEPECPQAAANSLIEAYLDAYGPASLRDMAWWSGLSATCVRTALSDSARGVRSVITPWSPNPLYIFVDAACPTEMRAEAGPVAVDFLAHEDVALKAYYETRQRYLGDRSARQIFNQIGEVRPAIVSDGVVVGRWWWDELDRCVRWLLFEQAQQAMRRACSRQADFLTAALRSRHDSPG